MIEFVGILDGRSVRATISGGHLHVEDGGLYLRARDLVRDKIIVGQAGLATAPATLDPADGEGFVCETLAAACDHVLSCHGLDPDTLPEGAIA